MNRKLPMIPTAIVLLAVAGGVVAGVWQLRRANENAALLSTYRAAAKLPPISFPTLPIRDADLPFYRYATGNCLRVVGQRTAAGENAEGEPGYLVILDCATGAEGPGMSVEVGWSKNPNQRTSWTGGLVSGLIVRDATSRIRLVADQPAPGLQASARPEPTVRVTPWRNKGYAATWFSLSVLALAIYFIALRRRWEKEQAK